MSSSGYSDVTSMQTHSYNDLISWAYQIAKGMEYLSLRKVLHGDLAARNVLLDENYVVKISDFGLARDVYKRNYMKQSEGPLPIKWLALECLKKGIYSTQSDVWAYGIVLWEIFSLGEAPYPGMDYGASFLKTLEDGYRLPSPKYATQKLYSIIHECWAVEPMDRPSFTRLVKKMASMLTPKQQQYFQNLNKPYDQETMSSFLASLRSPSYARSLEMGSQTAGSTQSLGQLHMHPESIKATYMNVPLESTENWRISNCSSASEEENVATNCYVPMDGCLDPVASPASGEDAERQKKPKLNTSSKENDYELAQGQKDCEVI